MSFFTTNPLLREFVNPTWRISEETALFLHWGGKQGKMAGFLLANVVLLLFYSLHSCRQNDMLHTSHLRKVRSNNRLNSDPHYNLSYSIFCVSFTLNSFIELERFKAFWQDQACPHVVDLLQDMNYSFRNSLSVPSVGRWVVKKRLSFYLKHLC